MKRVRMVCGLNKNEMEPHVAVSVGIFIVVTPLRKKNPFVAC